MGLPDSGEISASDINDELTDTSITDELSLDSNKARDLADVSSGEIKFSDFHGKSSVYVEKPSLTVEGESDEVPEDPTLDAGSFSVSGDDDTHVETEWEILDMDGNVVWSETITPYVEKPSLTVEGADDDEVPENPTLESNEPDVDDDIHVETEWEIVDMDGNVVWSDNYKA